ncbi:4-hydroxy-tetrahydrodipicolinate reductase [Tepidibacter hydrothermalis]|uniref:4-hydroxy-tetrahydrodipicolinate reductase n=1 Tax=Tepidibacter hydrothermalis TaxID=3036126 RepID=A0ABY8ELS5_9FIRM|nr:4-hydroxy-tetrahydrodipicolinate reductase [Tepidibacter hydrothermalis]WFD12373.1 4-hydroxy-tetrahydrodipicolinate reductase [Tepidibacter hydrothermalis]
MNLVIIGPKGKMGKLITKFAYESEKINIVGAVAPKGRDYIGEDIGSVCNLGKNIEAIVYDDLNDIIQKCDVIVDYTSPEVSMEVLKTAAKHNKSVVCGTTGFSKEQFDTIKDFSNDTPILYAANTSRLVNLMYKILDMVTKSVGDEADIEILEMHDRLKKDAPSGTAKEMGSVIANSLNKELSDLAEYGRCGERKEGSIGYHSIRSGDISSSHTVMFGLMGERLEITHHAYNWDCFAKGACKCITYLYGKEAGLYSVEDIL